MVLPKRGMPPPGLLPFDVPPNKQDSRSVFSVYPMGKREEDAFTKLGFIIATDTKNQTLLL